MKLLTKEIRDRLPPLYGQEGAGDDAIVYVKYFTPWTSWTWYITEGSAVVITDGEEENVPLSEVNEKMGHLFWKDKPVVDVRFFGLVDGLVAEWGYVLLSELEAQRGPFGLKIERDMYSGLQIIKEVKEQMDPHALAFA